MKIQGRWALVTGASSGIGRDFARELARRGAHVVLVARRAKRLEEVAAEIRAEFSVEAEVEVADLHAPDAATALQSRLVARGRSIDVLVNNAGFAMHGNFLEQDPARVREMIALNVTALTEMTRVFAQDMAAREGGHVVQVASIAGLTPLPSYAVYSGTKAYVVNFSESIAWELKEHDVAITLVLPGTTWTEFFEVAGGEASTPYNRMVGMKSEDVARIGVDAMLRRRSSVITGWRNWWTMNLSSVVPRHLRAWFTWKLQSRR